MLQTFLIPFLVALLVAATGMTVTFLVARRLDNFSLVDPVWAFGFTPLVFTYAAFAPEGTARRNAIVLMVALWSFRLAVHLFLRWQRHVPHEDVRYAKLREEWGVEAGKRMFRFYQLQGALQVVLSIPFLIVCLHKTPGNGPLGLGVFEWAGVALWLIGIAGETVADRQLTAFRTDPANKGKVCRIGLWNYSRHPNYFFEWLIWVGYFVFALGSPYGIVAILSPVAMWHFLVNVTGIPMTEELSVKSKGDAYREYQRTTSSFVPWFRRSA
jgi:steroid 5-alpha reductase family enzyme